MCSVWRITSILTKWIESIEDCHIVNQCAFRPRSGNICIYGFVVLVQLKKLIDAADLQTCRLENRKWMKSPATPRKGKSRGSKDFV